LTREEHLESIFEEGRRAWPEVSLEKAVFASWLDERWPPDRQRSPLFAADLFLACACCQGERGALTAFDRNYLCCVPDFLAGSRPSAEFVDEVRQQVRERLFVKGKIRQYCGRAPLQSWVRVATMRVASNLRKGGRPLATIDEALPDTALDPELDVIKRRYAATFRSALGRAVRTLTADERTLLRFHYLDGLNLRQIAAVLNSSHATMGRRVIAARERLICETRRILAERLRASPSELESLYRVVRSQIDVGLSSLLREGG
jgi:RNA polymerase sigma-70 factor (ECF subfamily)